MQFYDDVTNFEVSGFPPKTQKSKYLENKTFFPQITDFIHELNVTI